MAGFTTTEEWHAMDDGEKLYSKTWKPEGETKAIIVFVHGFSDHCNAFGGLFPKLAAYGIETFGFDQRGWGRSVKSPSQRGLSGPTPRVLQDIANILTILLPPAAAPAPASPPVFLMGHSMGGAETILFATSPLYAALNARVRGYLLASPYIRLHPATRPWRVTVAAGRVAAKVLPRFQMVQKLDPAYLSPDKDVIALFQTDELLHDTGTLEGMGGMLDRAALCDRRGGAVMADEVPGGKGGEQRRIWVCHGTEDLICDFRGTQRWTEEDCKVTDKTWKVYEGWLHRINDQEGAKKQEFADDVAKWVLERS